MAKIKVWNNGAPLIEIETENEELAIEAFKLFCQAGNEPSEQEETITREDFKKALSKAGPSGSQGCTEYVIGVYQEAVTIARKRQKIDDGPTAEEIEAESIQS